MPRTKAKNKPGSERFRDERREEGGPRMHGRQWHDHEEPRDLELESMAAPDAVLEAEGGGERVGMGKAKSGLRGTTGAKRKRMTPVGKGPKTAKRKTKKARAGKQVKARASR